MLNPVYVKAIGDAAKSAAKYPDHPSTHYAWIGVADTARLIRSALVKNFPGVKFYVRSHTYSGGASIDIYYDGRGDDCLWTLVDSSDNPYGDPVAYALIDYSSGRWMPILKDGAPTVRAVRDVVDAFGCGGFDGMIDMAYSTTSWLNPDGSAAYASSPGTAGSHGIYPAYDRPAPVLGSVPVRFAADYIHVNDYLPYDVRSKG